MDWSAARTYVLGPAKGVGQQPRVPGPGYAAASATGSGAGGQVPHAGNQGPVALVLPGSHLGHEPAHLLGLQRSLLVSRVWSTQSLSSFTCSRSPCAYDTTALAMRAIAARLGMWKLIQQPVAHGSLRWQSPAFSMALSSPSR